ncbi:hypothetical protein FN846DRAFT_491090 [Sphaerosporella brunnea]|uniref:Uncharacterized protein n=1 Tax=Sphaerosporella brunnea TaxID=1250544 RepID=A0A5J5EFA6_9PEZI|nr:hypothetical protein FN846DRAFT_491090 [Sphaerosporella brunnea]
MANVCIHFLEHTHFNPLEASIAAVGRFFFIIFFCLVWWGEKSRPAKHGYQIMMLPSSSRFAIRMYQHHHHPSASQGSCNFDLALHIRTMSCDACWCRCVQCVHRWTRIEGCIEIFCRRRLGGPSAPGSRKEKKCLTFFFVRTTKKKEDNGDIMYAGCVISLAQQDRRCNLFGTGATRVC